MKRAGTVLFIIKRNNMETIIDILMWLFFSATVIVLFLIIGDGIANKFPKSRFNKWWRDHIVSQNPYDSH
jgi:hypothetical protein